MVQMVQSLTDELISHVENIESQAISEFQTASEISKFLGAHYRGESIAAFGFWTPELLEQNIHSENIFLEIFRAPRDIDLTQKHQTIQFSLYHVPVIRAGQYCWVVVNGMVAGIRSQVGDLYWLKYTDANGHQHMITDPLAHSIPFGVNAPSEIYDLNGMFGQRTDQHYFESLEMIPDSDGQMRITEPVNILQIHVGTASSAGTLDGLNQIYQQIASKINSQSPLTPAEQNYVGYDAIQLMPIEPIIEYEAEPKLWDLIEYSDEAATVQLRRPTMINWGYDVVIAASPAINPVLLGSGRPDELLALINTLHNFPEKPIKILLDVVYGHADNQSLPLMNRHYFAGPNMYGQNLSYRHPVVRAILLEMQQRKSNYGIDGLRVDGAQDFKWWEAETDTLHYDDDYLELMNNVIQEVAGVQYRPWMIFEDGRPWPRDDWELASSYREVTKKLPNVYQWGPLTFAHNTPFLFTFWISKWWRLKEMAEFGGRWITGCANHDTLRRGTQVDPLTLKNTYLGDSLPDIFKNAYDHAAANLLHYACLPGIPMDFINASMRAPWSFMRNTGDRWIVKVMSEEARFLDWIVTEQNYQAAGAFNRLKSMGFETRDQLKRYQDVLTHFVQATHYDLDNISTLLASLTPELAINDYSPENLKNVARAWMEDVHDFCNVQNYVDQVNRIRSHFNAEVRSFRRTHHWLRDSLRVGDIFDYLHPTDGSVIYYGLRHAPDNSESILFVANMEGEPRSIVPVNLPLDGIEQFNWELALTTPNLTGRAVGTELILEDSEGVVFIAAR